MNIRVDLNTPIYDGAEVVFRSPVDCSQVTGLIVYYDGGSQEFAFADAHGNNVGDIDHLFAEDVVVKVILDVTTGMAFVQNADTNAYLEGRFDSIIDQLCSTITETGEKRMVQCEPVEGYPLDVTTVMGRDASKLTLTHCGKNLFNDIAWFESNGFTKQSDGSWLRSQLNKVCFVNTTQKSGSMYIAFTAKTDATTDPMYFAVYYTDGTVDGSIEVKQSASFVTKKGITNPNKTVDYIKWTYGGGGTYSIKDVMISFADGNYEPYTAQTYTVDFGKEVFGEYNWKTGVFFDSDDTLFYYQYHEDTGEFEELGHTIGTLETHTVRNIPAHKGVNTLFSDNGITHVIGKADPVAIIDKLTKAIIALGGNV